MKRRFCLCVFLFASPAWAASAAPAPAAQVSAEPAVASSQITVEPVIQLVAQAKPPHECGERGSDGILVLTQARRLCLCIGGEGSWRDVTTGGACRWDAQ